MAASSLCKDIASLIFRYSALIGTGYYAKGFEDFQGIYRSIFRFNLKLSTLKSLVLVLGCLS